MSLILGPAVLAAALLSVAGAQKLLDPTMTVGALRALRLPSSPMLVRVGSAAELAVGVGAVTLGGPVLWALVGASYLAFSLVVAAALRSGQMLGSCGCFGREETPPHRMHVGLNLAFAAASGLAAVAGRSTVDELPAAILERVGIASLLVVGVVLSYACYVELPRLFAAAATVRELDFAGLNQAGHPHQRPR
ncbi:MAG: MauE/DoxX family redox-associated membrane protein [Acidimicrobiales bacterium]